MAPKAKTIPEEADTVALAQVDKSDMSRKDWRAHMKAMGDAEGFYEDIGDEHTALFVRRGATLIVTFENLDHVYENSESRMPWGFNFVEDRGWSFLGMMAHTWSWYRDESIYDFFDRLRDEGFFESFDKVVFYGASMGAYAACAFSSAAPKSTVIAISPQATLDRQIASWETRYKKAWRRDYTTRYGYAPEMTSAAENVYLFYDPTEALDAMHASLFQGPNVQKFKCRYLGHRIASFWISLGLLKPIIQDCVDGTLTEPKFYERMRARRESMRYKRELLGRVQSRGRHDLVVRLCEYVLAQNRGPKFRQALKAAKAKLKI
ncbi:alpha/beta hydrolase [Falsihalocynthiibacter arcticus]|uniref:Phosphoadenosine phosphosulfate reductase n=1 Tax=Falsihalocynthiibacter arcticus TaxID=1579316 RepID=A0A126UXW2_9RHOB|nr:alpha/beta hydrolase [Falsihalocynthiibacter arcticus]AML50535.1 hypothetical protein RC74_03945 [Falsihalocynthiibacter arcticus]